MRHHATREQLAMLRKALDEHCYEANIPADSSLRKELETRILYLFSKGITELDGIKAQLREDRYM